MGNIVKLTTNIIKSGSTLQHMAGEIVDLTGQPSYDEKTPNLADALVKRGQAVFTEQAPTHLWDEGREGAIRGGAPIDPDVTDPTQVVAESTQSLARTPKVQVDPNSEVDEAPKVNTEKAQSLQQQNSQPPAPQAPVQPPAPAAPTAQAIANDPQLQNQK